LRHADAFFQPIETRRTPKSPGFDPAVDATPLQADCACDFKRLTERSRPIDPRLHRINLLDRAAGFLAGKVKDATAWRTHASLYV
jgi:hypothetical protein